MTVCRMTRSKVKVMEVSNLHVRKWPISKSISAGMHVVKKTMVNYDTPGQYLNVNRTDF